MSVLCASSVTVQPRSWHGLRSTRPTDVGRILKVVKILAANGQLITILTKIAPVTMALAGTDQDVSNMSASLFHLVGEFRAEESCTLLLQSISVCRNYDYRHSDVYEPRNYFPACFFSSQITSYYTMRDAVNSRQLCCGTADCRFPWFDIFTWRKI
jgi:hypothetical protein